MFNYTTNQTFGVSFHRSNHAWLAGPGWLLVAWPAGRLAMRTLPGNLFQFALRRRAMVALDRSQTSRRQQSRSLAGNKCQACQMVAHTALAMRSIRSPLVCIVAILLCVGTRGMLRCASYGRVLDTSRDEPVISAVLVRFNQFEQYWIKSFYAVWHLGVFTIVTMASAFHHPKKWLYRQVKGTYLKMGLDRLYVCICWINCACSVMLLYSTESSCPLFIL